MTAATESAPCNCSILRPVVMPNCPDMGFARCGLRDLQGVRPQASRVDLLLCWVQIVDVKI